LVTNSKPNALLFLLYFSLQLRALPAGLVLKKNNHDSYFLLI